MSPHLTPATFKAPDPVLVVLDWPAGAERRYYASAAQAAQHAGYYTLPTPGRHPGARALVYRLDEDASGQIDALFSKEITALRAGPGVMAANKADKARMKAWRDGFADMLRKLVRGLP